jgi:hypothetical protein
MSEASVTGGIPGSAESDDDVGGPELFTATVSRCGPFEQSANARRQHSAIANRILIDDNLLNRSRAIRIDLEREVRYCLAFCQ